MSKFAGYWKRLKEIKKYLGEGLNWLNTNILIPFKPLITQGLELAGVEGSDKILDIGSSIINVLNKDEPSEIVQGIIDTALETQKLPSERKNGGINTLQNVVANSTKKKFRRPFAIKDKK